MIFICFCFRMCLKTRHPKERGKKGVSFPPLGKDKSRDEISCLW